MEMLTARQIREKDYYRQFAQNFNINQHIDFSPVEGPLLEKERRPWNSYWRTYELPVDYFRDQKKSDLNLLDFGCGPGDNALRFSRVGYHVTGFDICEENIKTCNELFSINSCEEKGSFVVSPAEELPFQDNSFDVVVGIDILHHVDIPRAMEEVRRTLKDDGVAIFREPIEVPVFDKLRNTRLVRFFFPNTPSLENHITPDERKLNAQDLRLITSLFPEVKIERSLIFSRFDKLFRKHGDKTPSFLERIDHLICRVIPMIGHFGGAAVIILKKKSLLSIIAIALSPIQSLLLLL